MSEQYMMFDNTPEPAENTKEKADSGTFQEEIARIHELREELKRLNAQYYEKSVSEIQDTDYDFRMKELERLEALHPELETEESPTRHVGGEVVNWLVEVKHKVVMLSIQNVYEPGPVRKFAEDVYKKLPAGSKVRWVLELKIDGVAMSLHYRHGKLAQAVTRGDGKKGNDVTENVKTIADIPHELIASDPWYPVPDEVEIRGEVYMTNSGLSLLNERQKELGKELYANPRNAASGSILLKDPSECRQRPLKMFCHSVGDTSNLPCRNHSEFLEAVSSWGLAPTPDVQHFTEVEDAVRYCEEHQEALFEYEFEADGFVLKVDDFAQRALVGETPKFPKWLIALKFQKYQAETRVKNIYTQVGKTGVITPVAELEPVQIAGTVVSRSSLHNADEIRRKDIRIGDYVVVEKAGKIIPHIVRSEIHRRESALPEYSFPTECPVCGSELIQDEGGVYIRCSNAHCPARWSEKILYFGSRDAMNIKGLGDKLGKQLLEQGFIQSYADLYRLEETRKSEFFSENKSGEKKLERVGKKMAENLFEAIRRSKNRGLARLLTALSIPHLGVETAEVLAMKFLNMEALKNADLAEISEVEGVGSIIAQSVYSFLHSEEGEKIVADLQDAGVLMEFVDENGRLEAARAAEKTENGGSENVPLLGKTVVVTGKLERFTRPEIEGFIKKLGGKPASSVSAKTSFLICGKDAGSKLENAQKLGVPVLSEEEFLTKFELLQNSDEVSDEVSDETPGND